MCSRRVLASANGESRFGGKSNRRSPFGFGCFAISAQGRLSTARDARRAARFAQHDSRILLLGMTVDV